MSFQSLMFIRTHNALFPEKKKKSDLKSEKKNSILLLSERKGLSERSSARMHKILLTKRNKKILHNSQIRKYYMSETS